MSTEHEEITAESVVEAVTEVATAGVTASTGMLEMFAELLARQSESADNRMLLLAQELKRKTPEEEEKLAKERERSLAVTRSKIEIAKRAEAAKLMRQASCTHKRKNNTNALGGQRNSNNYSQAVCNNCGWLSGPFKLHQYEIESGLDIGSWGPDAFAMVQARVAASPPPPPLQELPFGATLQFVGE